MGLFTELPADLNEVDVIIAGGGTAGCVVAARLADADPKLEILVVERGPNNETPTVEVPVAFFAHLAPDSKTAYFNISKPSPEVADRPLVVPSGALLGGGSSINFMMYSRAQRHDFDAWKTPGWSADELLPYAKKSETYHSQYDEESNKLHGDSGPIHISRGTYGSPKVQAEYVSVIEKMGWKEAPDTLDVDSINTVWKGHRFISQAGKRQDAATCFIHPRLRDGKHPNLHVLVETQVSRVLFDDKKERAIGIEFRRNPIFEADAASCPMRSIKARKMVVVSSGACGTPLLLERSGVGDAQLLERVGVPTVVDLPGVGDDYEDHHLTAYGYKSSLEAAETGDALLYGRMGDMGDLIKSGIPMLGWNAQEMQGKIRPSEAEVEKLGPDFKKAWDSTFSQHPEKPMFLLNLIAGFPADPKFATGDPCIGTTIFTPYPYSRGSIHITGPTLDSAIDFDTGFFAGAHGYLDVKKNAWAYKKQREVIRRMASYRGEVAPSHPPFAPDSPAACVSLTEPLPADVKDIVYSAEDDVIIEKWIRENVGTTWHSLGTAKMRGKDERGVVDATLGVHGVRGLKVADLSIAPSNVACNTNATALMIGEKAAALFAQELGLVI